MEEDYSGGEQVADFGSDSGTAEAAKKFSSKWADEELDALRETRRLRKLAVYIYGALGISLVLLSSCLAWQLFDMVSTAFMLISYGALSKDELPTSGYVALLSTIPIGATMIAGVSVIAISMKAIKAANPPDSQNDNGTDTVAAVLKVINQQ